MLIDANVAREKEGRALDAAEEAGERLVVEKTAVQMRLAEELMARGEAEIGVAHLVGLVRSDPENRVAAERLVSAITCQ